MTGAHAITFNSLKNRLVLLGGHVVLSPPAPKGSVWLFGKGESYFPFTRGPIYPVRERPGDELIPRVMVQKILKHLGLDQNECAQFWNVQEHDRVGESL